MKTITSDQMRALEQSAIDGGQVTGLELMERAGRGVIEAIYENWPELSAGFHDAVVLCGPGNNGGDGFVVARLLIEAGWNVTVFFYGRESRLPTDALTNFQRLEGHLRLIQFEFPQVSDRNVEKFEAAAYGLSGCALVVDALFGIGLNRDIDGLSPLFAYTDIEALVGDKLTPARHVAIDLPSGMRADAPEPPKYLSWFLVDLTVTFHAMKPAHRHPYTARSCGKVVVKDIGL